MAKLPPCEHAFLSPHGTHYATHKTPPAALAARLATVMRRALLLLWIGSALFAQETPLARLKREAAHAKEAKRPGDLHAALRDWIESHLPGDKATLGESLSYSESTMRRELKDAGLNADDTPPPAADDDVGPGFGFVAFEFEQMPELPNTLMVTAGVTLPCGADQAVYLVHNRTNVFNYDLSDGVCRLDPVAFQPQDFAEEWLTRPWSEMQSRSLPETEPWHTKLRGEYVMGEYSSVVPCTAHPGRWLVNIEVTDIGEKSLPEPINSYFLVRELSKYRYQMESVSENKPKGCAGSGAASDKHPWIPIAKIDS
jgi:hypothetical protein